MSACDRPAREPESVDEMLTVLYEYAGDLLMQDQPHAAVPTILHAAAWIEERLATTSAAAAGAIPATVWLARGKTYEALFATEELARRFIAGLPASVGGGMAIYEFPVEGLAAPSQPAEPVAQAEQQTNPMLCPLCEADRSKEPCQGANPLKCHFAATAYAAEPAQQPQEALPPLPAHGIVGVKWALGYTADQMNERYRQGFRDGSRAPVPEAGLTDALARLERAVDLHLGRSGWTQTTHLKGHSYSEEVRKELYAAHDHARAILAAAKEPR